MEICYIFLHKEILKMKENKLVEFIANLTEEEIDIIISSLPRLSEVLEGLQVPCPPVPSLPNQ